MVRPRIEALLADPPKDEQMSVELAVAGAVLLGAVVSWLQTRVKISYSREGGETSFTVDIEKSAADSDLLTSVVKAIAGLFGAG